MRAFVSMLICFFLFAAMTPIASASTTAVETVADFDQSAARTGDLMTMLSIVALVAMAGFVVFIILIRSKRNKNPHE